MSSEFKLSAELRRELEAIANLARTADGPIADTYDRLQGVPFLRAARLSRSETDIAARVLVALAQCSSLAYFNVAALFVRVRKQLEARNINQQRVVAHDARWVSAILRMVHEIELTAAAVAPLSRIPISTDTESLGAQECMQELEKLEACMVDYYRDRKSDFLLALEDQYLLNATSVTLHELKSIQNILRRDGRGIHRRVPAKFLKEEILRLAVHSINTTSRTYLMQFRLFHQIPEVLAAEAVDLMDLAVSELEARRFQEASVAVRWVNIILQHICNSLWPLINLMYPSEYYLIRSHLGQTSGSKSRNIGVMLIGKKYVAVAKAFSSVPGAKEADGLRIQVALLDSYIRSWRDLHVMLPRNILGEGATSLIGNENAYRLVAKKREGIESQRHVLEMGGQGAYAPADTEETAAETILLEETGRITRKRFKEVEARTGRWRASGGGKK